MREILAPYGDIFMVLFTLACLESAAAAQEQVEKQLCRCLPSTLGESRVLLDLLIDEKGRTEQFASDPLLEGSVVSCLQTALSKMQFAATGQTYHIQRVIKFPSSCIAAQTEPEKPEPQPYAKVRIKGGGKDPARWIQMKIAGIVLLPIGGAITAFSLVFFFSSSLCFPESVPEGKCPDPPYTLLGITGAGVAMMLIGVTLLGVGSVRLKRASVSSNPKTWPFIAVAPSLSPGGVMASLAWRF